MVKKEGDRSLAAGIFLIEMIVDKTSIPIHTARRAIYVSDAGGGKRHRRGSQQRVFEICLI